MSVDKEIQEITLRLKEEITSKDTRLMRFVHKNADTGFLEPQYPIQIAAESITYVLDADDNKIDIYEQKDIGVISLTVAEITSLWMEQVTLADGSVSVLGNVLANKIDSLLAARFTE